MKRRTHKPHVVCGVACIQQLADGSSPSSLALGARQAAFLRALRSVVPVAVVTAVAVMALASIASAQDPSIRNQSTDNRVFRSQPGGPLGPVPKINNAAPLYLQGDDLVYDTKGSKIIARGNVQVYYNNFLLTADQITYDQSANLLIAEGNTQLRDPNGNITRAERYVTTDDFRDAFVESLNVTARDETRVQARRSIRRDGNITEFEQGKFTPCKSDPGQSPLWCIAGSRIVHDQKNATLTYQDAQFQVFGTTVLSLPYFQMPDPSVKHRTGFLTPTIGSSSTLGTFFELPYYIALDKSYDFLFNPSLLSKQGVLYKGEWRQRLENGQYSVRFGGINQDLRNLGSDATADLKGWRGTLETRGQFSLSSWWKAGWDVTLESDKSFRRFYGFDSVLQSDRLNTAYLTGINDRNYFNASLYQFGSLMPNDVDINKARVLPVIDYSYVAAPQVLGGELSFNGHFRNLTRMSGYNTASPSQLIAGADSTHLETDVNWRRKLIDGLGQTWTPFANVRGDALQYRDTRDPVTGLSAPADSLYRGVLSAGLTYAYPFVAAGPNSSHVVEPVVQVVTRQMSGTLDQRKLPNEDAKSIVFDDSALFFESKSTGFDRIDTGTRLNYGTKYTFQTNTGFNVRAVIGQSQHFAGTNVFADPGVDVTSSAAPGQFTSAFSLNNGLERRRSDYVAGLYVSPLQSLSLVTQGRFDSDTLALRRQDTLLSAAFGPFSTQLAYAFTRQDAQALTSATSGLSQQEVSGSVGVKLTDKWSLATTLRYDVDKKQRLQDALILKYTDECFMLTATYQETFIQNTVLGMVPDKTVMLRFELKNIGSFGAQTNLSSFLGSGDNAVSRN